MNFIFWKFTIICLIFSLWIQCIDLHGSNLHGSDLHGSSTDSSFSDAVRSQTAVAVYFSSNQLLLFVFAGAAVPVKTKRRTNVRLLLAHRLRRLANNKPTLVPRIAFAGEARR